MYKHLKIVLLLILIPVAQLLAQEATYTNSIGMEFVLIKPGSLPLCPYLK